MTGIEWTERTWNPTGGCTIVSRGCTNCYAMRSAASGRLRNHPKYAGTTKTVKGNPVWTGTIGIGDDKAFREPLTVRAPTMWFVNSMSDLFHEGIPDSVIDRVFAIMALCPHHTFQVLTKRPERMRAYLSDEDTELRIADQAMILDFDAVDEGRGFEVTDRRGDDGIEAFVNPWPLPNVWIGVSVEDQTRADERIPALLDTPAAVRFVSAEPLLGAVDFLNIAVDGERDLSFAEDDADLNEWGHLNALEKPASYPTLDWVIVGGESGPGARDCDLAHIRAIVEQGAAAGVPVFVKQIGARATLDGHRWGTPDRKGGNPADWPEVLRVRQMPGGVA